MIFYLFILKSIFNRLIIEFFLDRTITCFKINRYKLKNRLIKFLVLNMWYKEKMQGIEKLLIMTMFFSIKIFLNRIF
jgi:hypothetical protein